MMEKMMNQGSSMSEDQKKAKYEVVMELLQKATEMMAEGVDSGLKDMMPKAEVSVSADDPEDLEQGLDLASDLVEGDSLADIAASTAESSEPMVSEDDEEESLFGKSKEPKKKMYGMFSDED